MDAAGKEISPIRACPTNTSNSIRVNTIAPSGAFVFFYPIRATDSCYNLSAMKHSQRGFLKVFIIIICAIFVIGLLAKVFLFWQTRQALNEARNPSYTLNPPGNIYNMIGKSVIEIDTLAQASYNGKDYSGALVPNNTSMTNGSGINKNYKMPVTGNTTAKVLADAASNSGTLFVITNSGPTAYAVFGRIPTDPTHYYCVDSTGKSQQSVILTSARITCE